MGSHAHTGKFHNKTELAIQLASQLSLQMQAWLTIQSIASQLVTMLILQLNITYYIMNIIKYHCSYSQLATNSNVHMTAYYHLQYSVTQLAPTAVFRKDRQQGSNIMIYCLLLGTFVSLIGISYSEAAIIRDGKFVASYVYSQLVSV